MSNVEPICKSESSCCCLARLVAAGLLMFLSATGVTAQIRDPAPSLAPEQLDFFENKVRPVLEKHCLECHGRHLEKVRGGLWLTTRQGILEGGDSGPAVVGRDPEESLLVSCIRYETYEMPPSGQLSQPEIDALVKWVELGLPDPRKNQVAEVAIAPNLEEGRNFWAFQAPKKVRLEKATMTLGHATRLINMRLPPCKRSVCRPRRMPPD